MDTVISQKVEEGQTMQDAVDAGVEKMRQSLAAAVPNPTPRQALAHEMQLKIVRTVLEAIEKGRTTPIRPIELVECICIGMAAGIGTLARTMVVQIEDGHTGPSPETVTIDILARIADHALPDCETEVMTDFDDEIDREVDDYLNRG